MFIRVSGPSSESNPVGKNGTSNCTAGRRLQHGRGDLDIGLLVERHELDVVAVVGIVVARVMQIRLRADRVLLGASSAANPYGPDDRPDLFPHDLRRQCWTPCCGDEVVDRCRRAKPRGCRNSSKTRCEFLVRHLERRPVGMVTDTSETGEGRQLVARCARGSCLQVGPRGPGPFRRSFGGQVKFAVRGTPQTRRGSRPVGDDRIAWMPVEDGAMMRPSWPRQVDAPLRHCEVW